MIKLLLADDHSIVRDGINTLLKDQEDIQVIGEAQNGAEVLNTLLNHEVDVILMDINMPHMDGLEATSIIKEKYPHVKVVALTMYQEMHMVEAMFKHGAKAYLLKSCSRDELLSAIQGVAAGEQYVEEALRGDFEKHMQAPINRSSASGEVQVRVSKREKEVLQLISEEHTTAEIANKLFISVSTVESHRKNMLKKLGLRNTAGLMRYAFQHRLIS